MNSFVNNTLRATLALALLLLAQGCDSVVERTEPSTSVSQEVALSTPDAIQGIRASMYDRMHSNDMSTDWLLGPSALADNTYFRSNQQRHQQLNVNDNRAGIGTAAYNDIYNLINDANILISGIEEGAIPEDRAAKFAAEGKFMRALALHHAVRIFGYDPDGQGGVVSPNSGPGAGFDLGVEIRTEPTLDVSDATPKARSTVPEVYDQITSDLNDVISTFQNLPEGVKENSEFYPSEAAAQALLARVKLYQRDWQAADDAATEAISLANANFGSGLAPADSAGARSIFDETNGNPEAIFTIDTDPQTESAGINNSIAAYTTLQYLAQLPTQDLIELYEASDVRRAAWYDACYDEFNQERPDGCGEINQLEGAFDSDGDGEADTTAAGAELTKYSSEQGVENFADDYVHLRIAEMKLIQAEARMKGATGNGSAAEALNAVRNARGLGDLSGSVTMQEILDERRRELVAEGHRFFDLKRLGRDIRKVQGRSDIPFNDHRLLDDLPEAQLEVNDELIQNPGY